jgi:membrane protein
MVALVFVYRFAPYWHKSAPRRLVTPGAAVATLLWVVGSAAFSFHAARFGSYDRTYGPLGGAVVLMLWFYLTSYAILAGAELNAAIERRARQRDPRRGRPSGTGNRQQSSPLFR